MTHAPPLARADKYVGYNEWSGRNVAWVKVSVKSSVSSSAGAYTAHEVYEFWEKYLDGLNSKSPKSAGFAVQTCGLWARAETEVAAITGTVSAFARSTMRGCTRHQQVHIASPKKRGMVFDHELIKSICSRRFVISNFFAFMGILVFTGNLLVSLYCTLSIIFIVRGAGDDAQRCGAGAESRLKQSACDNRTIV